jgi:hypothetical protein
MKRNSLGIVAWVLVAVVVLVLAGAVSSAPTSRVYAQSDPTLDAAEQIIRQATRSAQQTRDARDYELARQRAEQTRIAGEATRVYAATRAALDAYATRQAIDERATRAAMEAHQTATAASARATQTAVYAGETATAEHRARAATATAEYAARAATATAEALYIEATARAIQREEQFHAAAIFFLATLAIVVVVFAAVAIRALIRPPQPIIVESPHADTLPPPPPPEPPPPPNVQTDLPKTRVILDPVAVQRITEILEFQERGESDDGEHDERFDDSHPA